MTFKEEYGIIVKLLEDEDKRCLPELPDYWETSKAIKSEIELFTRNLQETINFLDNDCTGEELAWLSEVWDEISATLQSWEFIDALKRAIDRFPEESKKYSLKNFLEYAIGALSDGVYRERFPDWKGEEA